jgi:hypothetical protein
MECVVNVVGFVVVFLAEGRQPWVMSSGDRLGFPLQRPTWKCINIRMATNESEFILGKACWIH